MNNKNEFRLPTNDEVESIYNFYIRQLKYNHSFLDPDDEEEVAAYRQQKDDIKQDLLESYIGVVDDYSTDDGHEGKAVIIMSSWSSDWNEVLIFEGDEDSSPEKREATCQKIRKVV